MSARVFRRVVRLALLTYLAASALSAQGQATLPDYGIWRLQNGPNLTFGSYPLQIFVTDTSVFIQGSGWDSLSSSRGFYADEVVSRQVSTVIWDTVATYNGNDTWRQSLTSAPGRFFYARQKAFDSGDPEAPFGDLANYLESCSRRSGTGELATTIIDSLVVRMPISRRTFAKVMPIVGFDRVRERTDDTIRYGWFYRHNDSLVARYTVRSYLDESNDGAISTVGSVAVDLEGFEVGPDAILAAWRSGDTLGLAWRKRDPQQSLALWVRHFDLHSGRAFTHPRAPVGAMAFGTPFFTFDHARGYAAGQAFVEIEEDRYQVVPELTAFDPRGGQQVWHRQMWPPRDWYAGQFFAARPDSAGRQVLYAFDTQRRFGNGTYDIDYRVEVRGLDAATGDSLWATTLVLDSFANRAHALVPMDIAIRPQGKGFVLAAAVSERTIDHERDLRYGHTALFFLDTLGCLVPGCREASAVGEETRPYEIQLAPNAVGRGQPIRVTVDGAMAVDYRWTITDASGRQVGFGESRSSTAPYLEVQPPALPTGAYYLTVRTDESSSGIVTKGFVVE